MHRPARRLSLGLSAYKKGEATACCRAVRSISSPDANMEIVTVLIFLLSRGIQTDLQPQRPWLKR